MRAKRILLFQLLCPILFIGFGQQFVLQFQLADNAEKAESTYSAFAHHKSTRTASFTTTTANSELTFSEDSSEEEFEQLDAKKQLILESGFLTFFSSQKPTFLVHDLNSKVAFTKRTVFYPSVKTSVLYQVFRT